MQPQPMLVILFTCLQKSQITGCVTRAKRWVPLVEQELHIIRVHTSSPPDFSRVRVTRSLILSVMFCRSLLKLFPLAIVLFVLLRFMESDYLFGIFKLILNNLASNLLNPMKVIPYTLNQISTLLFLVLTMNEIFVVGHLLTNRQSIITMKAHFSIIYINGTHKVVLNCYATSIG